MSIAFDRVFSEQDDTFTLQFVTGKTLHMQAFFPTKTNSLNNPYWRQIQLLFSDIQNNVT